MELPDIRRAIHHLVKDSNPDVRHFVSFLPPILRNDLCQEEKVRALLSWQGWSGLRCGVPLVSRHVGGDALADSLVVVAAGVDSSVARYSCPEMRRNED